MKYHSGNSDKFNEQQMTWLHLIRDHIASSVHFERLMGKDHASRMLLYGMKPNAQQALAMRLVIQVVPHAQLLPAAQSLAEQWVASGRSRALQLRVS